MMILAENPDLNCSKLWKKSVYSYTYLNKSMPEIEQAGLISSKIKGARTRLYNLTKKGVRVVEHIKAIDKLTGSGEWK